MSNIIQICNIQIQQDGQGRFCLNDLHRAAGGEKKYQPANWMRLDGTVGLAEEINRSSDVRNAIAVVQGGSMQGTFVCKELVYAYAMWISPRFHLEVIRTFDAVKTGALLPQPESARPEMRAMAILQVAGVSPQRAAIAALQFAGRQTGVDLIADFGPLIPNVSAGRAGTMNATDIAQALGVFCGTGKGDARKANKMLAMAGLQQLIGGEWKLTEKGNDFAEYRPVATARSSRMQIQWKPVVINRLESLQRSVA